MQGLKPGVIKLWVNNWFNLYSPTTRRSLLAQPDRRKLKKSADIFAVRLRLTVLIFRNEKWTESAPICGLDLLAAQLALFEKPADEARSVARDARDANAWEEEAVDAKRFYAHDESAARALGGAVGTRRLVGEAVAKADGVGGEPRGCVAMLLTLRHEKPRRDQLKERRNENPREAHGGTLRGDASSTLGRTPFPGFNGAVR